MYLRYKDIKSTNRYVHQMQISDMFIINKHVHTGTSNNRKKRAYIYNQQTNAYD